MNQRAGRSVHHWWAVSDNEADAPEPLDDVARVMGRVVWWGHTD